MIKVQDLRFQYPKAAMPTLKGLNFDIEKGEIFGFLGPSGSGKSTTQKILFKILSGYSGQALIDGRELSNWDRDLYQKIGVGFELPNHYLKLSALENLRFFGSFYYKGHQPMDLLDMVGLKGDAHKKVAEFSKGMKMRLNFIRAILHDPDILFLDEPTSGLDPVNAKILRDIILRLKSEGKTIFISTHLMYDAEKLCDRVAFIVDGEIKTIGSPDGLKQQYGEERVELKLRQEAEKRSFPLQGLGQNGAFLSALQAGELETVHSKEANLEDIFIKITGKTLAT